MMITESPENIKKKFLISDIPQLTESYMNLVEEYLRIKKDMLELYGKNYTLDQRALILTARDNVGFQKNYKDDTVVNKFWEECGDYINIIETAIEENKSLCARSTYEKAESMTNELLIGEYTNRYFNPNHIHFYQVEVFWNINGIPFKSKIDKVTIDTDKKKISFEDIKTHGGDFIHNYYEYSYWLQAILYKAPFLLMNYNKNSLFDIVNIELEINSPNEGLLEYVKDSFYTISDGFTFLTVDKSGQTLPTPYVANLDSSIYRHLQDIIFKNVKTNDMVYHPNWLNKAKELWQHISEDSWEAPIELKTKKIISL